MEELEYEREIEANTVAELNLAPRIFEVLPAMSKSPVQAYRKEVENCDLFLLVLWKSLRPAVRNELQLAVKLNKPILIFLKDLRKNEKRDQELVEFVESMGQYTYVHYRSLEELRNQIKNSVISEMSKFYQKPITTVSKEEMYNLGTSIARFAQKRLYIVQNTPSLLLGPRKYHDPVDKKLPYDKRIYDTLSEWVNQTLEDSTRTFVCLYSSRATKDEIGNDKVLAEKVRKEINRYKEIERESGHRFQLCDITAKFSGPMAIGDSRVAIWIMGDGEAVSISFDNERIANEFERILRRKLRKTTAGELIRNLGIVD